MHVVVPVLLEIEIYHRCLSAVVRGKIIKVSELLLNLCLHGKTGRHSDIKETLFISACVRVEGRNVCVCVRLKKYVCV